MKKTTTNTTMNSANFVMVGVVMNSFCVSYLLWWIPLICVYVCECVCQYLCECVYIPEYAYASFSISLSVNAIWGFYFAGYYDETDDTVWDPHSFLRDLYGL